MLERNQTSRPACENLGGAIVRTCDVCEALPVEDFSVACVGMPGRPHVRHCARLCFC